MKNRDLQWFLLVCLTAIFLAGCAGPPVQYKHQENFYSPYGGGAVMIGASGDITRDGTFEKGFVSYHPFNEGAIVTLREVTETTEYYPNLKPICNNYQGQLKKTKKVVFTHQVIMQGKVVYAWKDSQANWWAVGLTNLAGQLINRGIDAAFLYTMPIGEGISVAGATVGNITNKQKQSSKNTNINKNKLVNKNKIGIKNKSISGAEANAKAINTGSGKKCH